MSIIDYPAKARAAAQLLEKLGGPVIIRETKPGQYDPSTGKTVDEIIDWPTVGVKFGYAQDLIDGTLIQKVDEELYIAAQNIPLPTTADAAILGTKTYTIIAVQAIEPYDVPLLYVLQVRA